MSSTGPLSGEWETKRLLVDELIQYLHSTGNPEDEKRAERRTMSFTTIPTLLRLLPTDEVAPLKGHGEP